MPRKESSFAGLHNKKKERDPQQRRIIQIRKSFNIQSRP